jgi:NAD(P)-dependent dehydrogenase (short-subunit alcohol dehydrogenase family)
VKKLDGIIALIAGGTGNVGEGIVRAFLKEGATVVVPSRRAEALDQLREYLGPLATNNFVPLVGQIGQIEGAERLRDEILNRFGQLDAVVASLGSSWDGNLPLTQVPMEVWRQYLENNLTSHFVTARTFLPVLAQQKRGSYTLLGGSAAEVPIPNYSPVAIPAAGQLMLTKVVVEELRGSGVRINEVIANGWVLTRAKAGHGKSDWITADEIGAFTAYLASDEANMVNGSIINLNAVPFRSLFCNSQREEFATPGQNSFPPGSHTLFQKQV